MRLHSGRRRQLPYFSFAERIISKRDVIQTSLEEARSAVRIFAAESKHAGSIASPSSCLRDAAILFAVDVE